MARRHRCRLVIGCLAPFGALCDGSEVPRTTAQRREQQQLATHTAPAHHVGAADACAARSLQAGVQVAIESAVTKFDAIESFFERGERTAIVQLLRDEVLTDLKFSASSSEGKHVNSAVNRHVGIEFGKWKKGKS